MKRNVITDSLALANNLIDAIPPKRDWGIFNIALNKSDNFLLKNYPSIPPSFGYTQNETPKFMKDNNVIEGNTPGWWYVDISKQNSQWARTKPQEVTLDDQIERVAQEKGYIKNSEMVMYHAQGDDWGPKRHGQMAILVNKKRLEQFVGWHKGSSPQFDDKSGVFSYRGVNIAIKGEKSIRRFKLLFDNLGGIVTKKQFYEANGKKDYEIIKNRTGITRLHDSLEKGFEKLVKVIESEPFLNKSIIMLQRNGFGMFIDKNAKL
ncbi:MAG: hypothetical protein WC489_02980 [Patescibacteria group bacterium]